MKVSFKECCFRKTLEVDMNCLFWIEDQLSKGGIESQVKKTQKLLAIIATEFLSQNPDRARDVAQSIDCEGFDHKITRDEQ